MDVEYNENNQTNYSGIFHGHCTDQCPNFSGWWDSDKRGS